MHNYRPKLRSGSCSYSFCKKGAYFTMYFVDVKKLLSENQL